MKKLLIGLLIVFVVIFLAAKFVPLDPDERRPGLSLSGELAKEQNPNWSFLNKGRNKIWVQMSTWYLLPHSITTVSWVRDGQFYVPCGGCAEKNWPNHVERDNRVRLSVNGELYDRRATRLVDEADIRAALGLGPNQPMRKGVWVYRMDPR